MVALLVGIDFKKLHLSFRSTLAKLPTLGAKNEIVIFIDCTTTWAITFDDFFLVFGPFLAMVPLFYRKY